MKRIFIRGMLQYPRYSVTIETIVDLMGTTPFSDYWLWLLIMVCWLIILADV